MVAHLSMAAVAAGADGVLVEVHPSPETALNDGAQSLSFKAFEQMLQQLAPVATAVGRSLKATS
jgi:3-deoxy-7-phosphoheptulonate synthase